ncbi:GerA spore germination protein [Desulfofarcimen acetoxidans DSM 771]|uniref:GerA spore germination protein n=1 Tax=Desulfofarcimen acetoxidans (strain ATCC 49208 / DSM 771 / KCTC 5769 / VKM B-1644 / 5575) TaxID=485916 RepID=C8W2M4_DESAS|nr:spore germination protein [Desulfofarcimen acetoxidans]ACV63708.1 GerA spore germination protein [Desulfofarcimen acetoxidans DSM 771]
MNMINKLLKYISFHESSAQEEFILSENNKKNKLGSSHTENVSTESEKSLPSDERIKEDNKSGHLANQNKINNINNKDNISAVKRKIRKPISLSELKVQKNTKQDQHEEPGDTCQIKIDTCLETNKKILKLLYGLPKNKDVVIREFTLGTTPEIQGFLVFIDGLTDKALQDMLLKTLMLQTKEKHLGPDANNAEFMIKNLIPGNQVNTYNNYRKVLDAINYGETAIFLENLSHAITVETKGWEHRAVSRTMVEQIVRGPQEAFTETLRANTALIRKMLKNENLITEMIPAGVRNHGNVAIMYINNLANPMLVKEVKKRVASIKTDLLTDSGLLEQFIEDHPYNLNPQVIATERPDRVTALLIEGRVAIIVNGSPFVLIVPTTMFDLLHTGEENYLRWQYGTFLRYIRTLAFYIAFLLPGVYLSIVLFHHEMIPTDLLLAIAGNREKVPFPSVVEVLLMELSFEMIREAGLRLPGMMGSTIGIVGALILGQAAVQANIVSPILVILVAVTGLASFAIPNYSMSFALRIYRFFYIVLGASMGFFGITLGLSVHIFLTVNMKSFGVPYLTPMGPRVAPGTDVVTRLPLFFQEKRPDYINPLDKIRQPEISRGWIKNREAGEDEETK